MGSIFFKKGTEKLANSSKSFFNLEAKNIDGELINFSSYEGKIKAFLIVNVASS